LQGNENPEIQEMAKEMEKKFSAMGLDLVGSTPEETAAAIAADIPKWAKVIRDANIKTGN
jgi:tripartite-type tricarboxylate transporter receptor subunit TctC